LPVTSPLTGTEDIQLLQISKVEQLIADWLSAYQIDISDELSGRDWIYLYRCRRTGLKFFYPPDIQGSAKLYEQLQKFDWFYIADKWEHTIALQHIVSRARVLEVGAGTGAFITRCLQKDIDIIGLELNAAAIAEAHINALPIQNYDLSTFAPSHEGYFDAVCSFQVLEHISDPKSFIENMVCALKRGGRLMVSVPNADSFLQYDYNLLDMPPHHMTRWNRQSLSSLTKLFSLKLEEIRYEPLEGYHVQYFLKVYATQIKKKLSLKKDLSKDLLQVADRMLNSGLKRLFRGQGMFASYIKL
jgi:2-polyprenyl-3-methyl-5-hydroxy-6-metoxy-1,4-benzoquinol methylase